MEIKLIENEDFMELAELTISMYTHIDSNINAFQAVNTLIAFINTGKDFTAIGLYEDGVLVGFVTGIALNEVTFKFIGIYLLGKNSDNTKKLIDYSFNLIKEKGYLGWEAEATSDNIAGILEKYGASVKHTTYKKEFN